MNDLNLGNILLNEKSYENYLIYDNACKTQSGAKPLRFISGKLDGYISKYDGTIYLTLFHSNTKHEKTFDKINYVIILKAILQTFILINTQKSK